jgi:hypothetical protein
MKCRELFGDGFIQISLGSADVLFLWLPEATPGMDIFISPIEQDTFMGLVG